MPANTLVRDVMTRDVATLRAEQSIADAADNMASHNYGAMPVVDDAGRVVGLLRDSDFVVSEARVHVPTFLNILGASIPLPGEMSHVEEELHKVAGSTVGEVMEATRPRSRPTTRSRTSRPRCTTGRSHTSLSWKVIGVWSGSWRAATSFGSSPEPHEHP